MTVEANVLDLRLSDISILNCDDVAERCVKFEISNPAEVASAAAGGTNGVAADPKVDRAVDNEDTMLTSD
jgi:hypothetical protein